LSHALEHVPLLAALAAACGPSAPSSRLPGPAGRWLLLRSLPPPRCDGGCLSPLGYRLELTIDPREQRFFGRTRIEIQIDKPSRAVVLTARPRMMTAAITRPVQGRPARLAAG
jgi:hypothetical protein